MRLITNYFIAFSILFLVVGCSSAQMFKADPLDEKEVYKGREIVTKESENLIVSAEFDGQSGGDFVFYVDVQNVSERKIVVRPEEIFMEAVKKDLVSPDLSFSIFTSIDPENSLDDINNDIKNRKTTHDVATGLNAAFTLISIIGTIADANNHNDGARIAHKIGQWADHQIREEIDYDLSKKRLNEQREFWKNEVLQTTELANDSAIGGLVFIPFHPKVKYIRLVVPVEDEEFEFLFKVVKVK